MSAKKTLLDFETLVVVTVTAWPSSIEIQLAKLNHCETRDRIVFLNELGANDVVDYHEQNIRTISNDTRYVGFDNLGFPTYGTVGRRSSSPFRDYADRYLGSRHLLLYAWSLVNYVKFPVLQSIDRLIWYHQEVRHPSDATIGNVL